MQASVSRLAHVLVVCTTDLHARTFGRNKRDGGSAGRLRVAYSIATIEKQCCLCCLAPSTPRCRELACACSRPIRATTIPLSSFKPTGRRLPDPAPGLATDINRFTARPDPKELVGHQIDEPERHPANLIEEGLLPCNRWTPHRRSAPAVPGAKTAGIRKQAPRPSDAGHIPRFKHTLQCHRSSHFETSHIACTSWRLSAHAGSRSRPQICESLVPSRTLSDDRCTCHCEWHPEAGGISRHNAQH